MKEGSFNNRKEAAYEYKYCIRPVIFDILKSDPNALVP
jgi:hypothetical protein